MVFLFFFVVMLPLLFICRPDSATISNDSISIFDTVITVSNHQIGRHIRIDFMSQKNLIVICYVYINVANAIVEIMFAVQNCTER